MLCTVLTNELQKKFSWHGYKNNECLKCTNVAKIMIQVLQKDYPDATEADIVAVFSDNLRRKAAK